MPPGDEAHLGQVRFVVEKGTGCTFTEKARLDSLHSAQEVSLRHWIMHTIHWHAHTYIHMYTCRLSAKDITSLDISTGLLKEKKRDQTVKLLFQALIMSIKTRHKLWHELFRLDVSGCSLNCTTPLNPENWQGLKNQSQFCSFDLG